jgi:hypothetical protein
MEPLLVGETSRHRKAFTDLAIELTSCSAGFRRSLPDGVLTALADLVRSVNCYYSNLIEGHDTHPVDIERALKNDYSAEPEKGILQLEARAHIGVAGVIVGFCTVVGWLKSLVFVQGSGSSVSALKAIPVFGRISRGF